MSTLTTHTSDFAPSTAWPRPITEQGLHSMLALILDKFLANDPEYKHFGHAVTADGLRNYLLAAEDDLHDAPKVFQTLRWGGQFVYASASRSRVRLAAEQFRAQGFIIEREPGFLRNQPSWFNWLGRKVHFFIARKNLMVRPGEFTDRFTFNVELERYPHPDGGDSYVVCKRVPSVESIVARLRNRLPDAPPELMARRAKKFADKIFPTFLTREAAILKILQEHLPSRYARRVPQVIDIEKDARGFVTCLRMNWLRNGGDPLPQIEFAAQSADLLRAIHDSAGIIHLDLRLDNMVITEDGVGFVDFGSSVREGEELGANPLLDTLFDELMRTSHIQKMLYRMTRSGEITAKHFCAQHGRVDKGIDVFYLALQFTTPHANPDLAGLIQYDPSSKIAQEIAALSATVLRPANPHDTSHQSAKDILRSLELLDRRLGKRARTA